MFIKVNKEENACFSWTKAPGGFIVTKLFLYCIFSCLFIVPAVAQTGKKRLTADDISKKVDSTNKSLLGSSFPDFNYIADDGHVYSKEKLLGSKYYINFWFEACHPCMNEMNDLIVLHTKLEHTDSKFISFCLDAPETTKRVKQEKKLNFPVINVSREECSRLNLHNAFPTHIIVDEKGNIEYIGSLFKSNDETLAEITAILNNKQTVTQ